MPDRSRDWFGQAERDLEHAEASICHCHFEWACFASQQAAEKAVKALILARGGEAWGHSVLWLLESLPDELPCDEALLDRGRRLDRLYILPRYPNGFDQGRPADYYTREDADGAIADARAILEYCRGHLPGP